MKFLILIVFIFQRQVSSTSQIQDRQIGCIDGSQGDCQQICKQGWADCTITPPTCEFGYFLYPIFLGEEGEFDESTYIYECVKCPYQNFKDPLNLLCMDCVEHPYTWYLDKRCTYDYSIQNGVTFSGVYTRRNKTRSELYYILPTANQDLINEIYYTVRCEGCDYFCSNSSCQQGVDNLIVCLPGFYYYNQACMSCPDNCQQCQHVEKLICLSCNNGYAYNPQTQKCDACQSHCLNCYYGDEINFQDYSVVNRQNFELNAEKIKLRKYCTSCEDSDDGNSRIPSLDQTQCEDCNFNCRRCEYVSYDSILMQQDYLRYPTRYQYVDSFISQNQNLYSKRCRQCIATQENKLFISKDGETCTLCDLQNCDLCFQYLSWEKSYKTIDLDFTPSKDTDFTKYCFTCQDGFSVKDYQCVEIGSENQIQNCASQKYSSPNIQICSKCNQDFLLNNKCEVKCSNILDKCIYCYAFFDGSKDQYYCSKCQDGYYTDIKTGQCKPCSSDLTDISCKTCSQYNATINFTDYLLTTPQISNKQILEFQQSDIYVQCDSCQSRYQYLPYVKKCFACDTNCQECEQTLNKMYCTTCPMQFIIQPRSLTYDEIIIQPRSLTYDELSCIDCPNNCLACRERNQEEILAVNEDFNPTSALLLKYSLLCYLQYTDSYLDTRLGLAVNCESQTKKCIKTQSIDAFIYCDPYMYEAQKLIDPTNTSLYNFSSYFKSKSPNLATINFPQLDNTQTYRSFNELVLQEINLNIQFIGKKDEYGQSVCNFSSDTIIEINLQKNVFSLKNLTVNIIGNSGEDGQAVIFEMKGFLKFPHLRNVTLNNIRMISKYYEKNSEIEYFGLKFYDNGISQVTLINCIMGRENFTTGGQKWNQNKLKIFQMYLNNVEKLVLKNVILNPNYYDYKLSKLPFQFTASGFSFYLDNVTFLGWSMISQPIFQFNQFSGKNQIGQVGPKGVILRECLFFGASFISNKVGLQNSVVKIQKLLVDNSVFMDSSHIIELPTALWLENVDLINTQFLNNSQGFLSGSFQHVMNFFTFYVTLNNGSSIFKSITSTKLKSWNFQNLNIQSTDCQAVNCIMKLITPPNFDYYTNVTIDGLQLIDVYVNGLTDQEARSVDNAPIYISQMWNIKISNYHSKNNLGIIVMNLNQANFVSIEKAFLTNEGNNLIPLTIECAKQKNKLTSKTQIYISKIMTGASITSLEVRDLLLIDASAILIETYTARNLNTTLSNSQETYIFTQCQYFRNRIVLTELSSSVSLIQIISEQKLNIQLHSNLFFQNHMHSLVADQSVASSTCILVESLDSQFLLESSVFSQNAASNTKYGIVYIQSGQVNYTNSNFYDTNVFNFTEDITQNENSWLVRLESQDLTKIQSLSFFNIRSTGTCSYISAVDVIIQQVSFSQSFGLNGGAIYLEMNGQGNVKMQEVKFFDISSSLEYKDSTSGGCLYIDSSKSQLNLIGESVKMSGCLARNSGGCIHIQPSLNQQIIEIQNSYFTNCFALKYSFLDAAFSDFSQETNKVSFGNIQINQEQNLLHQFYYSLPELTESELTQIQLTSSVYYQRNGEFLLFDSFFFDIYYTTLLDLQNMNQITLTQISISNVELHTRELLIFDFANKGKQYMISSMHVSQVTEFNPDQYNQISNYTSLIVDPFIPSVLSPQQCVPTYTLIITPITIDLYLKIEDKYNFKQTKQIIIINSLQKISWLALYNGSEPQDAYNLRTIGLLTQIFTPVTDTTQTSVITIAQIKPNQIIKINQVSLSSISCTRCYNGLMQIKNVDNSDFQQRVNIKDFLCDSNTCGYWGCLTISKNDQFQKPDFKIDLQRRVLTPLSINQLGIHKIEISYSVFKQNTASIGAGLAVYGVSLLIYNTQFISNYAKYAAGGLYFNNTKDFKLTSDQNINITIYKTLFSNNQAQLYGAALLWNSSLSKEKEMEVVFSNNKGTILGSNLQEIASHLTIELIEGKLLEIKNNPLYENDFNGDGFTDSNLNKVVDEVVIQPFHALNFQNETAQGQNKTLSHFILLPSGQKISTYMYYHPDTQEYIPYNYVFRVLNLDRFYQKIGATENDYCKVTARSQIMGKFNDSKPWLTNYTGEVNTFIYNPSIAAFQMDNLVVIFDPHQSRDNYLQLKFVCSSVELPIYETSQPYSIQKILSNYELWVNVQTYDCQLGEFYSNAKCIACPFSSNTYVISKQATQCTGIDQNTMLEVTPTKIKVKPDFWRSYDDIDITEYCLNLPQNCQGGWNPGDDSCIQGHIGALCESCDLLGSRQGTAWATSGKCQCGKCKDILSQNIAIIIGISLFTLISMFISVSSTKDLVEQMLRNITLVTMGILVKENKSQIGILIKIFTNYFQVIAAITTFQLSLPGGFSVATETLGSPTKSMSVSYDCMFADIAPNIPTLYFRMIWALAIPFFYLTLFILTYCISLLIFGNPYKPIIIYTTFIYMFLYLQPTIIGGFIALASSRFISGYFWVQSDVSVRADGSSHILWTLVFVLPNLLLWALIFPAGWLYMLFKKRQELNSRDTRVKLGFFYNEYRISSYYWEFIKIFQKELITIFLIYYEDYVAIKGILIFVLVYGYSALTIRQKPYKSKLLNFLDYESASICSISICLGVLMSQSQQLGLTYISIIALIIIMLFNLLFILQMISCLFLGYVTEYQDKLDLIRIKIKEKYPLLGVKYPWLRPHLIIQSEMNQRVKYLWSIFRFEVRKSIKSKRFGKSLPGQKNIKNSLYSSEPREKVILKLQPLLDDDIDEKLVLKPQDQEKIQKSSIQETKIANDKIKGQNLDLSDETETEKNLRVSPSQNLQKVRTKIQKPNPDQSVEIPKEDSQQFKYDSKKVYPLQSEWMEKQDSNQIQKQQTIQQQFNTYQGDNVPFNPKNINTENDKLLQ